MPIQIIISFTYLVFLVRTVSRMVSDGYGVHFRAPSHTARFGTVGALGSAQAFGEDVMWRGRLAII